MPYFSRHNGDSYPELRRRNTRDRSYLRDTRNNTTKKVSFEANFYADGNLLGSGLSDFVTLAPGDEAIIKAQSDKGYLLLRSHEYTYKITKWNVYS